MTLTPRPPLHVEPPRDVSSSNSSRLSTGCRSDGSRVRSFGLLLSCLFAVGWGATSLAAPQDAPQSPTTSVESATAKENDPPRPSLPSAPAAAPVAASVAAPREASDAPRDAVDAPRDAVDAPRDAVDAWEQAGVASNEEAGDEAGKPSEAVEDGDLGDLPWREQVPTAGHAPTAPRSRTPQHMLKLMGIEQSQLESFFDQTPLTSDTDEALTRILFRLPQFSLEDIDRWAARDPDWDAVAESPDEFRGDFLRVAGTVTRVQRQKILPEIAALYDFQDYYRVEIEIHDSPFRAIVATRHVPPSWPEGETIQQRASVTGMFLKVGETPEGADAPNVVFAARRVAWHPDRVQPEDGITRSHVLLGDAGMDVGLLETLRKRNRRGMGGPDRESFYQMLDAMERLPDSDLRPAASRFDLAEMLTAPEKLHGRLYTADTVARRITRIGVTDPDIQSRFGIDHYYQVDCFVPLGNTVVRLGSKNDDQEDPVFTNHYPITFCTLELPEELKKISQKFNEGEIPSETLNERVRVTGFFWKLWAYQSDYLAQFDTQQQQWAPMLIGLRPELITPDPVSPWWGVLGGAAFLIVLAAIWIGVYRYTKADQKFEETRIKTQYELPPGKSLDDMNLDAPDKPDFSNLD